MFLKELVPVLAEVGRVNDLVEELFSFFFLLGSVRVGSVVSKVVSGAVGGVNHKCRLEKVCFGWEVSREGPYMLCVPVVVVKLHPCGSPFPSNTAFSVVLHRVLVVGAAQEAALPFPSCP